MDASDTINVILIGAGRIGRVHLDAWRSVSGVRVAAVCDESQEALGRVAGIGISTGTCAATLLDRGDYDIASICTPPDSHLRMARLCFERGVDVLSEKPFTIGLRQARDFVASAEEHGRRFLMATKFRHVPAVRAAHRLIHDGAIGEPLTFTIEFSAPVDMSRRWTSLAEVSGGGVIIDNGCHALDLARFLFEDIEAIHAVRLKQVQDLDVEDSAVLSLLMNSGVRGTITVSWSFRSAGDSYVTVRGSRGAIEIGWHASFLHVEGQGTTKIGEAYDKAAVHRHMMAACAKWIRGEEPPWIIPEDCIACVAAVDAAYASLDSGEWVGLAERRRAASIRGD